MALTESASDPVSARSGYLPIAEHGIIGDLHSVALIGVEGTIDWYCPRRFDAPSVFASILDKDKGGYYAIKPAEEEWSATQFYFPETNILVTRFLSESGIAELLGFMPIGHTKAEEHRHLLVRRVLGIKGEMRFRIEVEPRFDYGRARHETHVDGDGAVFATTDEEIGLYSPIQLERTAQGARAEFTLAAGESASFVLECLEDGRDRRTYSEDEARDLFVDTISFWNAWLAKSNYRGRWREMVHRSALTLKLLTYRPSGAIVAAATTSLPEQLGGERNWDYRFTWIRDASFSLYALLRLGFTEEAEAFMGWLTDRFRSPESDHPSGPLQIMYAIDGRGELPEETLDHLEGYRGSAPVRIGKGAADQVQLDIYGELVDSIYLFNKHGTPISHDAWLDVRKIIDWVDENWDGVDEGIWETRGGQQKFTYSRLMTWVAVERAIRIARQRGLPADLVRWSRTRDAIYEQIMSKGWHEKRGAFVQHYDTDVLDASVLLMPLVKFISPKDPRWLSTLDAIRDELVSDSLVYRYNVVASPDGLEGEEGTFSICSFWYVEALARAGKLDEARLAFEKQLTYANHLGLYSEEVGPTGELLGNFPQAFTHLALISAAVNLDRQLG